MLGQGKVTAVAAATAIPLIPALRIVPAGIAGAGAQALAAAEARGRARRAIRAAPAARVSVREEAKATVPAQVGTTVIGKVTARQRATLREAGIHSVPPETTSLRPPPSLRARTLPIRVDSLLTKPRPAPEKRKRVRNNSPNSSSRNHPRPFPRITLATAV